MASLSKEDNVLRLILESSPFKHWHFEEVLAESGVTRATGNKWLKKYKKEGIIRRIKQKGRFPYFVVGRGNRAYQAKKRAYMINKLYSSGLIGYLLSLEGAKTIIIFGSIAKGDWYKDSDIDIFILGKTKNIEKHKYELNLKRDIELHVFESKAEIKKIRTGLIKNIANGYVVKGSVLDVVEVN